MIRFHTRKSAAILTLPNPKEKGVRLATDSLSMESQLEELVRLSEEREDQLGCRIGLCEGREAGLLDDL